MQRWALVLATLMLVACSDEEMKRSVSHSLNSWCHQQYNCVADDETNR